MIQFSLGSKDGTEDPVEFVENIKFHIDSSEYATYTGKDLLRL